MAVDYSKVYFLTSNTIDKVLYESPTISGNYSGGGTSSPAAHNFSIPHVIGQSVIATGRFSIDGSNFYPCGMSLPGAISGISAVPQFLLCDIYADASSVYTYIENAFDSTKTIYVEYTLEALS